jgi:hypothetical protein
MALIFKCELFSLSHETTLQAIYPCYHESESYNAYLITEQFQQTVSFMVQNKHRIGLITTPVARTRTRNKFRHIATMRPVS